MASAMPVLPEVASTTVWPGLSAPRASASSMIAIARRSLTEERGLKNSHLTYIVMPGGRQVLDPDDRRAADRAEDVVVNHGLADRSSQAGGTLVPRPCVIDK